MAIINIPVTYTTTATAANLNDCNTTIYNEFNGNIDNDNISASAEIAPTKLDLANGFAIVQTKTTGNALTVTRDLAAASTNSPVVQITQDNSGDDQHVVSIQNDGTGHGIHVDQNGNGDAIRIENDGTSFGVIINQNVVLASTKYALKVYSNAAQTNSELVQIHLDNASSSTPALHVRNDGSGIANITRAYLTLPNGQVELVKINNGKGVSVNPGSSAEVDVCSNNIVKGRVYTIKLVATDGAEVTVRVRA